VWVGPRSDIYVYRMTMTNEDGFVVEYTPDFMRYRCEQMGVKCVPVMDKFIIPETSKTSDLKQTMVTNIKLRVNMLRISQKSIMMVQIRLARLIFVRA